MLGLIGKIYDYVLVEYPNAEMIVDTGQVTRAGFSVNTSRIDRSGTEIGKTVAFDVDEILLIKIPNEWASFQARQIIEDFNEHINQLNSPRR